MALSFQRGFLALGYVDGGSHPFVDPTIQRYNRHRLNVKMPIAPIASTNPKLVLVHAFLRHCLLPQSLAALLILGVKSLKPTKVARFIFALPRKIVPAGSDEESFALCVCPPHHIRACHYQCPVPRLAFAQSAFFVTPFADKPRQKYQRKRDRNQEQLEREHIFRR